MKKDDYLINSMLHISGGKIKGPMGPTHFMNAMAKEWGEQYTHLARLSFKDREVCNIYEGKGKTGLTGHDFLLLAARYQNDIVLNLFIDTGSYGIPVFMMCDTDREYISTPIFEKWRGRFEKCPSNLDLKQIANYCLDNFDDLFDIKGLYEYREKQNAQATQ